MSQDLFSFQQFIIGLLQLSSRHRSDWDPEEIASLLHQITGREFQYAPPLASATSSSENIPASETPDKSPSPQHPDSPTPSPPSSQTTMFMDEIVKHQSSSTITQQAESTAHHISATSKTLQQDAINNATFPMSVSEMVCWPAFEWVSRLLHKFLWHTKNPDFVLDDEINAHLLFQCIDALFPFSVTLS